MTTRIIEIDLSKDENKFIKRYIGKTWRLSLPGTILRSIMNLFGPDLGNEIILRKRTLEELTELSVKHVLKQTKIAEDRLENLHFQIRYFIGKGESVKFTFDNVIINLVMKW